MLTLGELIKAPKLVVFPALPKTKSPPTMRDVDLEVDVDASGLKGKVVMYVRFNPTLESFSIGLRLEQKGRAPNQLTRINGGHAQHKNPGGVVIPSLAVHIHRPPAAQMVLPYTVEPDLREAFLLKGLTDMDGGWPEFAKWVCISPSDSMTRLVAEMANPTSQTSLEDAWHGR